MATKKASTSSESVVIQPISQALIEVPIVGITELICHAWDEKTKGKIEQDQTTPGRMGKKVREPKDPAANYRASLYVIEEDADNFEDSVFGFPAIAFKAAMVRAAKMVGITMTDARQVFFIEGDLVRIEGRPHMRRDVVRLQGKTVDLRYRGAFRNWKASVPITYDADLVSADSVVNLLNRAGFSVGVGEWRPEKDGLKGRFRVAA